MTQLILQSFQAVSHLVTIYAVALAARSPVIDAVLDHAARGGAVMGVCNGFQVLLETGLLPGVLVQNAG